MTSKVEAPTLPASVNSRASRRVNTYLAIGLLALVAVAPLPLGSNRAVFWATNAGIVGALALIYSVVLVIRRQSLRFPASNLGLGVWAFGVFASYLVVQVLPIGQVLQGLTSLGLERWNIVPRAISIVPSATLLMFVRTVTYGVFVLLVLQVGVNDRRRDWVSSALLAAITLYALGGIVSLRLGDTLLGLQKWAYIGAATGTFVNRNSFATFLAFGVAISVAQVLGVVTADDDEEREGQPGSDVRPMWLALHFLAICILIAAILATQSRMGAFVTLVGTVVIAALTLARQKVRFPVLVLIFGCVGIGAASAFWLYGAGLLDRLGSIERASEDRSALYAQVVQMISLRPWLGYGGGSFALAFPLVHEWPVSADVVWDRAHNTYLALWAELGIIFGSIPCLMVLITATRLFLSILRRQGSWRAQATAIGVIVIGAVHSLVDFSLEIQADTFVFLMLISLGVASLPANGAAQSRRHRSLAR